MNARDLSLNLRSRVAAWLVRLAYRFHISATRNTVFRWEQASAPRDKRRSSRGRRRMARLFTQP